MVNNFIEAESNLYVDFNLKFPFHFRAELYERKDTIEFDVKDLLGDNVKTADDVEYIILHFTCNNKLPLDINLKSWVIDGDDNFVETVFEEKQIIVSGVPGADGRVAEAKETKFEVRLTGSQAINYIEKGVMNIVLNTKANTYDNGAHLIKIFDNSGLEMKVSFEAKMTIPINF